MLPTSYWLHWSTNERPSEDSAKLKTTASAKRAGPGSRAARLGDSVPVLRDSARPDGPAPAGDTAAAAPSTTAVTASAAASLALPIVSGCEMVVFMFGTGRLIGR